MDSQTVFVAGIPCEVPGMIIPVNYHDQNAGGAYRCRATQLTPAWDRLIPGEPVSLDIEFQNYKHTSWEQWRHRVGRVAIVNTKGETVLDVYAAYPKEEGVTKLMPPERFLVSHQDLRFVNGAVPAGKVENWVKRILHGRTVIVHGVDTQAMYYYLQWDGTPSLKNTAAAILGESVQEVVHSPVEDAQTALKLWLLQSKYDRDAEVAKLHARRQELKQPVSKPPAAKHPARRTEKSQAGQYDEKTTRPASTWSQVTARVPNRPPQINDQKEFPPLGKGTESKGHGGKRNL